MPSAPGCASQDRTDLFVEFSRNEEVRLGNPRVACYRQKADTSLESLSQFRSDIIAYPRAHALRCPPTFQQEARATGGSLRLHDRVALSGGRALLANRWTRGFAVAYMGLLHLFVFAVLYRSSAGTTVYVDALPSPPPVVLPRSAGLFGRR